MGQSKSLSTCKGCAKSRYENSMVTGCNRCASLNLIRDRWVFPASLMVCPTLIHLATRWVFVFQIEIISY